MLLVMRAKKSMKLFFLGIIFIFHTLSANADSTNLQPNILMVVQTQCCYGDVSQVDMSAGIASPGYPPNNTTIITGQNTAGWGVNCASGGRLVTTCTSTNCNMMECGGVFVDVLGNPLQHIKCCMVAGNVCPAMPTC